VTSLLIENAYRDFYRASRVRQCEPADRSAFRDGVIAEIGGAQRRTERTQARCPRLRDLSRPEISTHHHLFQSVLKGVKSGINLPLAGWLRSVS